MKPACSTETGRSERQSSRYQMVNICKDVSSKYENSYLLPPYASVNTWGDFCYTSRFSWSELLEKYDGSVFRQSFRSENRWHIKIFNSPILEIVNGPALSSSPTNHRFTCLCLIYRLRWQNRTTRAPSEIIHGIRLN